jgi:S-DNA-T family DNA segregation ATPase FtsK/SpoIIIE
MSTNLQPFDDDDDRPVPVDPPVEPRVIDGHVLAARTIDKRPIVPGWMRNRAEFRALLAWLARYGIHVTMYHGTRTPLYYAKLVARSPVGGWRVARGVFRWVFDHEQATVRADAVRRNATAEYLTLSRQRNDRVRKRGIVAVLLFVLLTTAALLVYYLAPSWLQAGVFVSVVGALGAVGMPADKRVTGRATVSALAPPRLSAESVTRALLALGISEMNKKGATIEFAAPITRDGPGWRADIDLPHGCTPAMVMDRRPELASGLRRQLGCVWPGAAGEEHAGRLILWVGDVDLSKAKQPPWPLLRSGSADLFKPIPFGTDQRGRIVTVTLMFASMIVGSIPRMGKTFAVRLLLLAASLDVLAELHLYELKGSGDFSALEPVAHAYRAGDDLEDIEYILADLQALGAELRRRMKVIRNLPKDMCPESKITPELAAKRSLGLHPIVVSADECQRMFEHPKYGGDLESLAEDLVRRGPAAGITAIFATQRPDAKSLPTGISGNAVLRFCLKVMGHQPNDQVLGTSAHRNGIKATIFSRRDLGIGWLAGEEDDPQITRTFYVDNPSAEIVVTRARAMRERAGTLSGYCLGEQENLTPAASVLDDLKVVFAQAEATKLSSERLLELLAALRPEVYGSWTPEALSAALRPDGVKPGQVWTEEGNRKGYLLNQINEAINRNQIEVA